MKILQKITRLIIILLIVVFCSILKANDWLDINTFNTDGFEMSSSNYFDRVVALSDSSIWVSGPGHGIYKYKDGTWTNYFEFWHNSNQHFWITRLNSIVENFKNSLWIASDHLIKFDEYDSIYIHDRIFDGILNMIEKNGFIYMINGDTSGVLKFDGDSSYTMIQYKDTSFFPYPFPFSDMIIDSNNNFYFSTEFGLMKYDGTHFTHYNTQNSQLPLDNIRFLTKDYKNKIWMSFLQLDPSNPIITSFDGTDFESFDFNNSNLPDSTEYYTIVGGIGVDKKNNKWFGIGRSLYKFNDTTWVKFDSSNSPISIKRDIYSIEADLYGNVWFATGDGLLVYQEGGVNLPTSVNDEKKDIPSFSVFPNPSENTLKIKYTNVTSGQVKITLTDINGNTKMERIRNTEVSGEQTDIIDTTALEAGTYFVKIEAGKVSAVNKVVIVK